MERELCLDVCTMPAGSGKLSTGDAFRELSVGVMARLHGGDEEEAVNMAMDAPLVVVQVLMVGSRRAREACSVFECEFRIGCAPVSA